METAHQAQNGLVVGVDVGGQGADAVLAGLFKEDFKQLGADALFLKSVANGDGDLGSVLAGADVARAGNRRAFAPGQVGIGDEALAAGKARFRQCARLFQHPHWRDVGG